MTWNPEICLGDLLNSILVVAAVTGLLLTCRQLKQTADTVRAGFIRSLVTDFYGNPSIYDAFYHVDCGILSIEGIINGTEEEEMEKSLDSMLCYLDMVARLVKLKAITRQDAMVLEYELVTCYKSEEIQTYLAYLDELYLRRGQNLKPHPYFRDFASSLL